MNADLRQFFDALDEELQQHADSGEQLELYLLGRMSFVVDARRQVTTADVDVVETNSELQRKAHELFGKSSGNHKKFGLYLDLVPPGMPPLPGGFQARSRPVEGEWGVIRVFQLEDHDLAVTKLKSFRTQDRDDLQFLADHGSLDPEVLRVRLESAFMWSHPKDGDPARERAFANLKKLIQYLEGRTRTL